jgi:hypothetical protein
MPSISVSRVCNVIKVNSWTEPQNTPWNGFPAMSVRAAHIREHQIWPAKGA